MSQDVVVASSNPAKIQAVASAFAEAFPTVSWQVRGIAVPSGVAAQPLTSSETLQGALNRLDALQLTTQADFYVAIEAGLDQGMTFAWMLVSDGHKVGRARSASLMLPDAVQQQLQQGLELGDAMDSLFGTSNIKQAGGAIGLLTQHKLTRSSVYHQALLLALIPFLSPRWF